MGQPEVEEWELYMEEEAEMQIVGVEQELQRPVYVIREMPAGRMIIYHSHIESSRDVS
jgi:hypothetical protein